jgi:hypothetical protein
MTVYDFTQSGKQLKNILLLYIISKNSLHTLCLLFRECGSLKFENRKDGFKFVNVGDPDFTFLNYS